MLLTEPEAKLAKAELFRGRVHRWAQSNGRHFPWRGRRSPFGILIAELMLRRTRADQVAPVYKRFMERFPDARSLAAGSEDEVSEIVRSLGLAWRTSAFRQLAMALLDRHGGEVPSDSEQLRALPGVGDYVASAVRSFAFDLAAVPVDTNTVRVAGRYFGFAYHPESRRKQEVRADIALLIESSRPRKSAQGLLDFAALICRSVAPRHDDCPVAEGCSFRGLLDASEGRSA